MTIGPLDPPFSLLRERRDRVAELAAAKGLCAVLVTRPEHVRYLTGVSAANPVFAWLGLSEGAVLGRSGTFDTESVAGQGLEALSYTAYEPDHLVDPVAQAIEALDTMVRLRATGRIGTDLCGVRWRIGALQEHEIVDLAEDFSRIRRPRDAWEIARLRNCVTALEAGFIAGRACAVPGATELGVHTAISGAIANAVGRPVRLDHNIGSGPRGAEPDPQATARSLEDGDLLIVDLYPPLDGYVVDLTRTWAIGSLSTSGERLQHAACAALRAAEATLGPGTPAADVDRAVRSALRMIDGLDRSMSHHAGHGIGLFAWDAPWIGRGSADRLMAGDTIAIEPGAYVAGVGGVRLEGNYLITADGYERLDTYPEDLMT